MVSGLGRSGDDRGTPAWQGPTRTGPWDEPQPQRQPADAGVDVEVARLSVAAERVEVLAVPGTDRMLEQPVENEHVRALGFVGCFGHARTVPGRLTPPQARLPPYTSAGYV